MVEIANSAVVSRASVHDGKRPAAASRDADAPAPLTAVAVDQWRVLCERALEPNGYYLPEWELAVNASARDRTGASALTAWSNVSSSQGNAARLIGLIPVVSMWRAYRIPLPALVSAQPYGTLCTPPLDRDLADHAVTGLIEDARKAGGRALILRDVPVEGAAIKAFNEVLRRSGQRAGLLQCHFRACLDARRDADELLHQALGPKKLKELRRQRRRLADHGAIGFEVARTREEVSGAVEIFLALEASGWKGRRGTALTKNEGDAQFIRRGTAALAETGQCEIATLRAGDTPVAAAIVLRHQDRAFYFKLGVDERFAKFSPGAQLTLEVTRHLCADRTIALVDSTAGPDHPMINPIWRGRLAIGDLLIPLRRNDPLVTLIYAVMTSHLMIRGLARRMVQFIRRARSRTS